MRRACFRLSLVAAVAVLASSACGTDDSTNRKCYETATAYARPDLGESCNAPVPIVLSYCETLPSARCPAGTAPSYVCLSPPNSGGLVVQLSPCGTLDSIPLSWYFADDRADASPNAIGDCEAAAANTCSSGKITGIVGSDVPSGAQNN